MIGLLALFSMAGGATIRADSTVCGAYAAVLAKVRPDTTAPLVIIDSTAAGVPGFALAATTSRGAPLPASGVPWSDSIRAKYLGANRVRGALSPCLSMTKRITLVPGDSLVAHFRAAGGEGWARFNAAHPGSQGFLMLSQPTWIDDRHREALIYVGTASAILSGSGRIFYLRFDGTTWTVVGSATTWVS